MSTELKLNRSYKSKTEENTLRTVFNCGSLFQTDVGETAGNDSDDSSVLPASEAESVLKATDEENEPHESVAEPGSEDIFLASDEENQQPRSQNRRRASQASFLGKPVCIHALQALLGIGTSTIQRLRAGERAFTNSRRPSRQKHPTFGFALDHNSSAMWPGIVMFLWETYQSCAEVLPTDFKMPKETEVQVPEHRDPDLEERLVNHFVRSLESYTSDPDVHMVGPGTFAGPCRFLQCSTRTELYWEYSASCHAKGVSPASYSTFLRVANAVLKPGIRNQHLRFRGVTQHGSCNTCYDLKQKLKTGNMAKRQEAYRNYSHHLLSQWLDRQQYWSYRSLSTSTFKTMVEMGRKILS